MGRINITEQVHRVDVQEGVVQVSTVGVAGPPGPQGPPGDLDLEELNQIIDSAVTEHSDLDTGVHGVGESTVASTDDVTAARSAAQDYADSAVSDHNAATNVHGVDTTQLATQEDLDNLDVLPEPGDDGDVLTLADGEPTWAQPEGGGGLDPDGDEVITGDWHFDRQNLRVGANNRLAVGVGATLSDGGSNNMAIGVGAHGAHLGVAVGNNASAASTEATALGYQSRAFIACTSLGSNAGGGPSNGRHSTAVERHAGYSNAGESQVALGSAAGYQNVGDHEIAIGRSAGREQSGDLGMFIGHTAGQYNERDNRLIIDNAISDNGNLIDPLIDGRFRAGTDDDAFEYAKGVKINGHLEATDQLILRSPNGSRWAITVDDEGNLSTAPATEEITP